MSSNLQLFDSQTAPDTPASKVCAEVVVPPLHEGFLYALPPEIESQVSIGSKLVVPLGSRKVEGYVVKAPSVPGSEPSYKLKAASALSSDTTCFDQETLSFYQWMADYYCVPLGKVLETAVPDPVTRNTSATFSFQADDAVSFRCQINTRDPFTCSSPRTIDGLEHGPQVFSVIAIDVNRITANTFGNLSDFKI